jgi:hypothetical protein
MRIVVANEPRAYREVLGAALGVLRPQATILVSEPGQLEEVIERFTPHLVVCSHLVTGMPLAWVVLDPDAPAERMGQFGLDDVLALVDEAAQWSETMP